MPPHPSPLPQDGGEGEKRLLKVFRMIKARILTQTDLTIYTHGANTRIPSPPDKGEKVRMRGF
jgi:hypothetical protein